MQRLNRGWYVIYGIIGVLVIVAAFWYLLSSASAQIASSVIAASATVLVAVFGTIASKQLEQKREIEKEQRERKAAIYQEGVDYWFSAMQGVRKRMSEKQRNEFDEEHRTSFSKNLVLWGSDDVINKYADFVRWDDPEGGDIFEFEEFLLTLRKDLGYRDKGFEKGNLLKTFLKGVRERLEADKISPQGGSRDAETSGSIL
jgi:hypothetical protein